MENLTDSYIEYKEVSGTPQQIMAQYADIVNVALKENRMGMSKRWGELMELGVRHFWLEEINGTFFACTYWHTEKYMTKTEFLAQGEEEDTIE